MKRYRQRKGFTLVEILVVVIIITMLATMITPQIYSKFVKAKANLARTGIAKLENSLAEFLLDCGRFPTEGDGGLDALRVAPSDLLEVWDGPYVREHDLYDPWDNPYVYHFPATLSDGEYDIISYGADGVAGGDRENADIYNN
ncbi:MAG: hypothetical protein AMJ79_06165 [Phycisphaerae bacterium SM23_30]|nr:MAG: hypothetical protein AMJ79_06165 [Phycisphaerae bacterium SM23_30]